MEYRSEQDAEVVPRSVRPLVDLYERKTLAILQRYGPGPRVHYHTGFVDNPKRMASVAGLRSQLVKAQERMLMYSADAWRLRNIEFQDVLDVGCGLGGSAIFWAQEFGARVTAITIAPSHIELVERFAALAGVKSRVLPLLCDASEVSGENCFDAAIAIESSSLFPRRPWFRCLAKLLRPAGRVFISDCFLEGSEYEKTFNHHWCAQIGTVEEYLSAAQEAQFKLTKIENVSLRAATFWTTTLALIRAEAREARLDPSQLRTSEESYLAHASMRQGLVDGGLRQLLMTFQK
jgi:tocopherol O-methyltransferase